MRDLPAGDRLARAAAVFDFVGQLVKALPAAPAGRRHGMVALVEGVGPHRGPAVILTALLLALGERARVECLREMAFVRVELSEADVQRLPSHARAHLSGHRCFLPLDPRGGQPFGFLADPLRQALEKRLTA